MHYPHILPHYHVVRGEGVGMKEVEIKDAF